MAKSREKVLDKLREKAGDQDAYDPLAFGDGGVAAAALRAS